MFNRFVLFLTSILIAMILLMAVYQGTQATSKQGQIPTVNRGSRSLQPLIVNQPASIYTDQSPSQIVDDIQEPVQQINPIIITPTATIIQPTSVPVTQSGQPGRPNPAPIVPMLINHSQPELSSSEGAFTFGGCTPGSLSCPADSLIGMLGCQRVVVRDLVGGLDPAVPAGWCIIDQGLPFDNLLFQYVPGFQPFYRSYIVYQDGMYRLVGDQSFLKSMYAPIETRDEALSYALLLTDYQPVYNLVFNPNFNYQVYTIEDTYVEVSLVGFEVHLFTTQWQPGACPSSTTYAVDLLVAWDGTISIINTQPQWIESYCG